MGSVPMDSSTANQTYLEKTFHKVLWGKTWICQALAPADTDSQESACNAEDSGPISGWEDPLEKGAATHSTILTWKIPWTEEPGGLPSMGSQRVRTNTFP